MSISERRAVRGVVRGSAALAACVTRHRMVYAMAAAAALLAAAGAPRAGAQTPSITPVGRTLTFGSVMPGQTPVTVAPWSVSGAGAQRYRSAAVLQITGAANGTVYVKVLALPATIENGGGGMLALTGYLVQYNTVNSAAGAVSLSSTIGAETAVTLNAQGTGFVSIGATASPSAAQAKGGYGLGEGGMVSVR